MRITQKDDKKPDLPIFLKTSRPAEEIYAEAQHYNVIRNMKISDIVRYAQKKDENIKITEDEALFGLWALL